MHGMHNIGVIISDVGMIVQLIYWVDMDHVHMSHLLYLVVELV